MIASRRSIRRSLALAAITSLIGCGNTIEQAASGGSGGMTTSTTSETNPGGAGGEGGMTGCVPGTLVECYTGPAGTQDVGTCHAGAKKCNDDGLTFGPCEWEVTPKPDDCKTPEDEDCDGAAAPCPGLAIWSTAKGGPGDQFTQGVAVDTQGNVIVVGGFTGTFVLGPSTLVSKGQTDVFIVKFDASGNVLWAKGFGSVNDDYPADVAADAQGNIVVTGSVAGNVDFGDGPLAGFGQEDIFLVKLDPGGALLWRKMLGSAEPDIGYGVTTDPQGNVYTTGEYAGTIDFGAGAVTANAGDGYVAKYSPQGAPLWVKTFGAAYEDFGSSVSLDPTGNLLVTGGFHGPVDFGTGPIDTAGYYDGFVAKIDPAGKTLWATPMKGANLPNSYPIAFSVSADTHGAAIVGGYFFGSVDLGGGTLVSAGGTDAFIAKYDADGSHVWSQRYGGTYVYPGQPKYPTDALYSLATDAADNVIVTGSYGDTIDFGAGPLPPTSYGSAFVAKLDPAGKQVWSKGLGSVSSYASGTGVAVTSSGEAVITGYFTGTIDLGNGPFSTMTVQDSDFYLAKLAP